MPYAEVNGLRLYFEVHGTGRPLVLLHGGLLTIDLSFGGVLPTLAENRQVIAVELQGHGHTEDIEREPLPSHLASDIVGLLDQLGIERADVFGFSLGGLVALTLATSHPERVNHVVLASTHVRHDGYHPEITAPEQTSDRLPTEADFQLWHDVYQQIAPDPANFFKFAEKMSATAHSFPEWAPDELRAITAPTLIVLGDHDFIKLEHAVEMHDLIPNARLAVLPGTTHNGVVARTDLLLPIVTGFLPAQ